MINFQDLFPFTIKLINLSLLCSFSLVINNDVMAQIIINNETINTPKYNFQNNLISQKVTPSFNSNPLSSFFGEWLLEDLAGGGVTDNLQTTLTLTQDGKIFGNAGCNNYTGTYEITGNKINISPLASTRKFCTPALMNQETKFLQVLQSINTIDYNQPFLFMDSPMRETTLKFTRLSS